MVSPLIINTKKSVMKAIKIFSSIAFVTLFTVSCKKYQEIGEAEFADQQIYMPAAVEGNSTGGVYFVNKVAVAGQVYRYTADVAAKRFNISLAVYRSGANTKGSVPVNVAVNTDTAAKLLAAGKFPAGTEVLTLGKYNLPSTVTIGDGKGYEPFNFSIDLDFLLANLTKKFAIGVGVSSNERKTGIYGTTILLIDPAFLVPTAGFTSSINSRTVSFSNTSLNGVNFVWDYGDGTPTSTERAAPHTYAAAGTYTVKLTTLGALGDFNKVTYTATVVIP